MWSRTKPTKTGPYRYRDRNRPDIDVEVVEMQEPAGSFLAVKGLYPGALVELRLLEGEWSASPHLITTEESH